MLLAQLTDPHVTVPGVLSQGFVDTAGALRRAVAHVGNLRPAPDVVLLTGDLVDSVEPAGYRLLRELLAPLSMPVYAIPGNHDERTLLREAFLPDGYLPTEGNFLNYVVEGYPLRLIGLDSQRVGEIGGELCAARLEWLARRLEEAPQKPTLLFMHHPPFVTGMPSDRYGFPGAEALGALLERHRQVKRIVSGHVHRAIHAQWHGVHASSCPSTAHQLALDLGGPRSRIALEPPAVQLHHWQPEGDAVVTYLSPVGDYPQRELARH